MLDILRRVIDGTITIPTRQQVADRTKVALINDVSSNNTPSDLFTGLYKVDSDGEHNENKNWLKKTGRYPSIPFLFGSPIDESAYERVIQQSEYGSVIWPNQDAKVSDLDTLFPAESTGDLFIGRTDNDASGEFGLSHNTCSAVELTFAPHTFSVIKEGAASLAVYLNNYRTDKEPLWAEYPEGFSSSTLRNTVLPNFVDNPTDGDLRESRIVVRGCSSEPTFTVTETGSHEPSAVTSDFQRGELIITLLHNGPLNIDIHAEVTNAGRLPGPTDDPIRPPAPPSASGRADR